MKSMLLTASLITLGAFVSACGASSSPAAPPPPAPSRTAAASPQPTDAEPAPSVATVAAGKLGTILTDGHGVTLYLFEKDTPNHSACTGTCADDWMPYTTNGRMPVAGTGVTPSLLTAITRTDGSTQLTYHTHPLYYYSDDRKTAGSIEGQGKNEYGGLWYTLTPDGAADTSQQ